MNLHSRGVWVFKMAGSGFLEKEKKTSPLQIMEVPDHIIPKSTQTCVPFMGSWVDGGSKNLDSKNQDPIFYL